MPVRRTKTTNRARDAARQGQDPREAVAWQAARPPFGGSIPPQPSRLGREPIRRVGEAPKRDRFCRSLAPGPPVEDWLF